MIIRAQDQKVTEHTNLRDGKGSLTMKHFFTAEESWGTGRMFSVATLPSGSSIGKHAHNGEYEIYLVLEGSVNVTDNDKPFTLNAGDCMICKDGDTHSVENASGRDAKIMFLIVLTKKA